MRFRTAAVVGMVTAVIVAIMIHLSLDVAGYPTASGQVSVLIGAIAGLFGGAIAAIAAA